MAFRKLLLHIGAAGALALAAFTPVAVADQRGDRGHYDRGDRGDRYHGDRHRGNRDYHRGDRRGDYKHRRDNRRDYRRGRDYHRNNHRYHNRGRVVTRNYYSAPTYHRTRPRVVYHYNRGYHHPRYTIGNRYHYGSNSVIIRDYGRYGLYSPPRGHQWVHHRGSNDAVLTSVATGAIVGLAIGILSH
ncbi:MAG: RcnB family protein [Henriciella sp.]|nr:RcnB family protein [Henriciella sp.]